MVKNSHKQRQIMLFNTLMSSGVNEGKAKETGKMVTVRENIGGQTIGVIEINNCEVVH